MPPTLERSVGTEDMRWRWVQMEVLMQCVCCGKGIAPLGAWRSSSGKFYCSEFCADVETIEASTVSSPPPQPNSSRER